MVSHRTQQRSTAAPGSTWCASACESLMWFAKRRHVARFFNVCRHVAHGRCDGMGMPPLTAHTRLDYRLDGSLQSAAALPMSGHRGLGYGYPLVK